MENRQKKWWMPDLYMKNNDKRMYRICVIHEIRRFFEHEGFAEVETPALQISPGLEVHLRRLCMIRLITAMRNITCTHRRSLR